MCPTWAHHGPNISPQPPPVPNVFLQFSAMPQRRSARTKTMLRRKYFNLYSKYLLSSAGRLDRNTITEQVLHGISKICHGTTEAKPD
jgi:hypothetical protein